MAIAGLLTVLLFFYWWRIDFNTVPLLVFVHNSCACEKKATLGFPCTVSRRKSFQPAVRECWRGNGETRISASLKNICEFVRMSFPSVLQSHNEWMQLNRKKPPCINRVYCTYVQRWRRPLARALNPREVYKVLTMINFCIPPIHV